MTFVFKQHNWYGENAGLILSTFDKSNANFFDIKQLSFGGMENKVSYYNLSNIVP
jgi:hypothetical protein